MADRRKRWDEEITKRVRRARAADVSWQEIGAALGITRQAAWQRFGGAAAAGVADLPADVIAELRRVGSHDLVTELKRLGEVRPEVDAWLQTPSQALGYALGRREPIAPADLLAHPSRRLSNYLMSYVHDRSSQAPGSSP